MILFEGVATALVTPICNDKIDFVELEKLVNFQIENGVSTLVVLGTTGEPSTMTKDEKYAVIENVIKFADKRAKIIVGTGGNNTKEVLEMTKIVCTQAIDGILAVTPYYNKCTENGLIQYFNEIMDISSVPVIAYNVPSRTSVNISLKAAREISKHKNFAGIKEASGNMCQIMSLIAENITVYSGDDSLGLSLMALGGKGIVSVCSNVYPKEMNQLCTFALSGEIEKAREIHNKFFEIFNIFFLEVNPIPVKYALSLRGFSSMDLRLPLTLIEKENAVKVQNAMEKIK